MTTNAPLRLHWWKAKPNFGDALNPLIVEQISARAVKHAPPKKADMFAIGSMLQVVRRNFGAAQDVRPIIWGTGLLHPVNGNGFVQNIDVALLRGPVTAALLGIEVDHFGDPGLLTNVVLPFTGARGDKIGIVPHHSLADDADLAALVASDPVFELIDPRGDTKTVCHQIAGCAHIFASSLHGLIVADAYGVANTWVAPAGQSRLKYLDYAASVGRRDMRAPVSLAAIPKAAKPDTIHYSDGIARCRAALHDTFPDAYKSRKAA